MHFHRVEPIPPEWIEEVRSSLESEWQRKKFKVAKEKTPVVSSRLPCVGSHFIEVMWAAEGKMHSCHILVFVWDAWGVHFNSVNLNFGMHLSLGNFYIFLLTVPGPSQFLGSWISEGKGRGPWFLSWKTLGKFNLAHDRGYWEQSLSIFLHQRHEYQLTCIVIINSIQGITQEDPEGQCLAAPPAKNKLKQTNIYFCEREIEENIFPCYNFTY